MKHTVSVFAVAFLAAFASTKVVLALTSFTWIGPIHVN